MRTLLIQTFRCGAVTHWSYPSVDDAVVAARASWSSRCVVHDAPVTEVTVHELENES